MANTLPNRITETQAEATATATYVQYAALAAVYDDIRSHANGGDFSYVATVPDEHVSFINSELNNDGYDTTVEGSNITITWGEAPDT